MSEVALILGTFRGDFAASLDANLVTFSVVDAYLFRFLFLSLLARHTADDTEIAWLSTKMDGR